jgi:two-component system response regulator FlrC
MTAETAGKVLIVDDQPLERQALVDLLRHRGVPVEAASDGHEALRLLRRGAHRLVVSDYAMPGLDGLGLMRQVKRELPSARFVLLTGAASIAIAVAALREGADDVIEKPIAPERLLSLVARATASQDGLDIVTEAPGMLAALERARRIAPTEATVLIQGESGTGKELLARAIHRWSPRADGPFVAVNCAAIPETLVEAELFGHERGAFTDARIARPGMIEQADGGTLFLDEIGEMPMAAQAKLLRVLQDRSVRRIGSTDTRAVDVRFVAATNQSLRALVRDRRFREDLFFRLDVLALEVPPLRERVSDVALLAAHFARRWGGAYGWPDVAIAPEALAHLQAHAWPGNVRELENVIHRALIESSGGAILPEHLTLETGAERVAAPRAGASRTPGRTWKDAERELIFATLAEVGGNRRRAAQVMGMGERTLRNKLKLYREVGAR